MPLAKIGARGDGRQDARRARLTAERVPKYFSVKEAVFPFAKFPDADPILGPEMKSTGEVMGTGRTFGEAYAKAQLASGVVLPTRGVCLRQRARARQARRGRARQASLVARASRSSRPTAPRGARASGHRLPTRQQGARGPAAHRRHDQERRDQPDRQHDRGQAGDPRVALDPPRGRARKSPTTRPSPRRLATCDAIDHLQDVDVNRLQDLHSGGGGMSKDALDARRRERLRTELQRLKTEERPAHHPGDRRGARHGDLSENAEYHAAREQQGFSEGASRTSRRTSPTPRSSTWRAAGARQGRVRRDGRTRRQDGRQGEVPDRRRRRGRHQVMSRSLPPIARALVGKSADVVEVAPRERRLRSLIEARSRIRRITSARSFAENRPDVADPLYEFTGLRARSSTFGASSIGRRRGACTSSWCSSAALSSATTPQEPRCHLRSSRRGQGAAGAFSAARASRPFEARARDERSSKIERAGLPSTRPVRACPRGRLRSRAVFKLEEIQRRRPVSAADGVDLGAAPGGWSQYAARLAGGAASSRSTCCRWICDSEGDFMATFTRRVARHTRDAATRRRPCVCPTWPPTSAGSRTWTSPAMALALESSARFRARGSRPAATLRHEGVPGRGVRLAGASCARRFATVRIRKPKGVQARSSETYLLAEGPRPV